jgi:hypothetical protein
MKKHSFAAFLLSPFLLVSCVNVNKQVTQYGVQAVLLSDGVPLKNKPVKVTVNEDSALCQTDATGYLSVSRQHELGLDWLGFPTRFRLGLCQIRIECGGYHAETFRFHRYTPSRSTPGVVEKNGKLLLGKVELRKTGRMHSNQD